jgi:hypothetical protein
MFNVFFILFAETFYSIRMRLECLHLAIDAIFRHSCDAPRLAFDNCVLFQVRTALLCVCIHKSPMFTYPDRRPRNCPVICRRYGAMNSKHPPFGVLLALGKIYGINYLFRQPETALPSPSVSLSLFHSLAGPKQSPTFPG